MKLKFKIVLCILALVLLAQLIRPEEISLAKTPQAKALTGVPQKIAKILETSCFDCHSDQTQWRWFDRLTPVNFLVASHIRDGRKSLDFSHWDSLATPQRNAMLYFALNGILSKEMPLSSYTALHPAAKLNPEDIDLLKTYLLNNAVSKPADVENAEKATEKQAVQGVKKSPNGIAYLPDYRNWKAISTTERFDNGTIRIIFGNPVAVEAIRTGKINPWPDGTIFAKTAWKQQKAKDGSVYAGQFVQVEFMIKNAKQYAHTKGWGWARWKGENLLPYGKTVKFDTECISCHRPERNNDYVFTTPLAINDLNRK
ncbi:cytochrome P460 family protein [Pedobacter miscanthi]|uniref:Cytochrome P460 n=1 Tax=Pedobacter miscanthi TaxID=2259170 RepID=A0A366LBY7_9SPHI|nr:cytochrome P460 family protein [Pedobacter miscanthi]RBQ11405.1 cytochrome P460 [Pedobacter miscanthi]